MFDLGCHPACPFSLWFSISLMSDRNLAVFSFGLDLCCSSISTRSCAVECESLVSLEYVR